MGTGDYIRLRTFKQISSLVNKNKKNFDTIIIDNTIDDLGSFNTVYNTRDYYVKDVHSINGEIYYELCHHSLTVVMVIHNSCVAKVLKEYDKLFWRQLLYTVGDFIKSLKIKTIINNDVSVTQSFSIKDLRIFTKFIRFDETTNQPKFVTYYGVNQEDYNDLQLSENDLQQLIVKDSVVINNKHTVYSSKIDSIFN